MSHAVVVKGRKVRYAVVGIGWISQTAFLPGVEHTGNSEVVSVRQRARGQSCEGGREVRCNRSLQLRRI